MKDIYAVKQQLCLLLFLSLGMTSLSAQLSFSVGNDLLSNTGGYYSGIAVGILDMNGDKLDDILCLDDAKNLKIEYQTPGGNTFTAMTHGIVANKNQWMICAADLDNDGFGDVMTGDNGQSYLLMSDGTGTSFNQSDISGSDYFAQNSNFADVNNDGFLDAFICNDVGLSEIFLGDGAGNLATWGNIDFSTTPVSDGSGNYGSIFTDFDNDGDLDFYISKCRQNVNDPADPRRINALFVNDGNNNYTEQAGDFGLKIGWQSWTTSFEDIDNDGDYDAFITNHDFQAQILENDGAGHFTDITATTNVDLTGFLLQGVMRDFDNDGFVDILISGGASYYLKNNGDKTFTQVNNLFNGEVIHTFGLGDLNNDGFLDIYAGYGSGYTTPGTNKDLLWLNDGNTNNHLCVNLEGTTSNRSAVGARVEIFGDWGIQVREVRSGESYGIVNSLTKRFGLGTATEVDYMVVKWPSGKVEVITSPTINTCNDLIEGTCEPAAINVTSSSTSMILCQGESLTLTAAPGYDTYLWNDGFVGATRNISAPGNYTVVGHTEGECAGISSVMSISYSPDETPTVMVDGETTFCQGLSVNLTASAANGYTWSTGAPEQSISVETSGEYTVTIEGACGDFTSEPVMVEVLPAAPPVLTGETISAPGTATLTGSGGNILWYEDLVSTTEIGSGNTFVTPVLDATTTYYASATYEYGGGEFIGGKPDNTDGGGGENTPNFNGFNRFEVYEPFTLKSVKTYAFGEAERTIQLLDGATNAVLQSITVNIPDGESVVELNFDIPVSNDLILGCAEDPSLYRQNDGVSFPYDLGTVGKITTSSYGMQYYYYFFDWKMEIEPITCVSERAPVQVIYDELSSTLGVGEQNAIQVFPNPSTGIINLDLTKTSGDLLEVKVHDLTGKLIYQEALTQAQASLNLEHLAKGMYLLQVNTSEFTYSTKVVLR